MIEGNDGLSILTFPKKVSAVPKIVKPKGLNVPSFGNNPALLREQHIQLVKELEMQRKEALLQQRRSQQVKRNIAILIAMLMVIEAI